MNSIALAVEGSGMRDRLESAKTCALREHGHQVANRTFAIHYTILYNDVFRIRSHALP